MKTKPAFRNRSRKQSRKFGALFVGSLLPLLFRPIAANAAAFSDADWSSLGSGMDGPVYALAVSGTNLYAGGDFAHAGGVSVNRIARWNGSGWSALGSGMDGTVYALAVDGTDLYAGGSFTNAGGVAANRIARWSGSGWSALGSGMDGPVYAVTASGGTAYAGGSFINADGAVVNNIAKWQGAWSAMRNPGPDGMTPGVVGGSVFALTGLNSGLGVAGTFTSAGGWPNTYCIADWTGYSWTSVDSGLAAPVQALVSSGTDCYAGGSFTVTRNNTTLKNIGKWNGSIWSSLTYYGVNQGVRGLVMSGTNLYAGGDFTTAGWISASHIASYNDSDYWSALGSGVNGSVYALAVDGSDHLFVGGAFLVAGNGACAYIAQANLAGSISGGTLSSPVFSRVSGFTCIFSNATVGKTYRIQSRCCLVTGAWTDLTNFTYTGPITIKDPYCVGTASYLYRAACP